MQLAFNADDSQRAHADWGANCGPHALAAACGKSLEAIHKVIPQFRGWMGPTEIEAALKALHITARKTPNLNTKTPCNAGISRIQWHGPWLNPGSKDAYKHTHWIAGRNYGIYDTLYPEKTGMWIPLAEWRPLIENHVRLHFAGWHITHWYQF